MTLITSSHDLQDPGQTGTAGGERSPYAYLFAELANDPAAGLFAGTDESGTVQRLKDFEIACRLPFDALISAGLTIELPAAYTYFGQFMNHDISAPVGSLLTDLAGLPPQGIIGTANPPGLGKVSRGEVEAILTHVANEHARPLMLASLYGDGPQSSDREVAALYDGAMFRLGQTSVTADQSFADQKIPPDNVFHASGAPDIPRGDRIALIADRRNDGNLILSQLHLAFMLFHNKAVVALADQGVSQGKLFDRARELVTLHYHWLILNDVLPAILSKTVLTRPLAQWRPRKIPPGRVPMEFTTAAFRFGHSMVGRAYDFNANFGQGGRISTQGASLMQLFRFTSHGNMEDPEGPPRSLPDHWVIDWDRLTRDQTAPNGPQGHAERIDLDFAPDMLNSAGDAKVAEEGSILFRNLLRGFHRRMPFGQQLAEACGVPLLSPKDLLAAMPQHASPSGDFPNPAAAAKALGLLDQTPAWLYLLCEAQVLEKGRRVGPTASQIIADTVISLMQSDPGSLLSQAGGGWTPEDSPLMDEADAPLRSLRSFLRFAVR